jgi:hypothetical protein
VYIQLSGFRERLFALVVLGGLKEVCDQGPDKQVGRYNPSTEEDQHEGQDKSDTRRTSHDNS